MRTRNQGKRQHQTTTGEEDVIQLIHDSESQGSLSGISHEAVGKLLKRVNSRKSPGLKKQDSNLHQCDSIGKLQSGSKGNDKQVIGTCDSQNSSEAKSFNGEVIKNTPLEVKVEGGSFQHASPDGEDEMNDSDWEDGSIPLLNSSNKHREDTSKGVAIEFDAAPDSAKRKTIRRASAEDKELAELVHKVHLLCLLGRGRLIDFACNDPLIQASLLSLLPTHLLKISEVSKLTANALVPLVNWFHNNFHIRSSNSTERSFHSALAFALETREGTSEEVAALSVALFRALDLTTRFVSILDVASLKPDADKSESIGQNANRAGSGIFKSSTLMVAQPNQVSVSPAKQSAYDDKDNVCETSLRGSCKTRSISQLKEPFVADKLNDNVLDSLPCEAQNNISDLGLTKKFEGSKRKGDLEFETQLEMALSATAVGSRTNIGVDMHSNSSTFSSPLKRMKKIISEESSSSSQGISTAVGSRKVGPPLYWAEVYCIGENLTGKWVHVDAVNAIIDGEQKVEAAAAACKTFLRYAVAFAGHGAKDVTRRYCIKWYKIASQRINSIWWDAVLAPLKELESGSTGSTVHLKQEASNEHEKAETLKISDHSTLKCILGPVNLSEKSPVVVSKVDGEKMDAESSVRNSFVATRTSLEDMELETRALTEPLPTNQQAYRNHHLYALERWLTKYEILHPKGPILGFCSGHPVYPRTCVRTLHTKERWLREGLQIKVNELAAKVLKRSLKTSKAQVCEADDHGEGDCGGTISLYGKWQTEPLCLPRAVDGIVPKNERGQVDAWSEKCLPPGTVHLRLPRVFPIAKRLEIDYAPAMVGFEFRNGRSIPVFDGIVVCAEFKDVILEAYAEVEERREAEEKKRNEMQAISRWYQLLSSIVTRQRLKNCYVDGLSSHASNEIKKTTEKCCAQGGSEDDGQTPGCQQQNMQDNKRDALRSVPTGEHEHVFLADDQTFDEESSTRTKRCHCGFWIQVEDL